MLELDMFLCAGVPGGTPRYSNFFHVLSKIEFSNQKVCSLRAGNTVDFNTPLNRFVLDILFKDAASFKLSHPVQSSHQADNLPYKQL